jgi:DNA-binding transcriptional ArsR family regulator
VAAVAALIASPARAAMLDLLMDSRRHSAGELAQVAAIAPSTASTHLAALAAGGLVVAETQGRQRHYRLAGPDVAAVLETLATIAPPVPPRSLRQSRRNETIRAARTCYDHLAGQLGVDLTNQLIAEHTLRPRGRDYALSRAGEQRLRQLGVDVEGARRRRRAFARSCLDWTEQRPHLAGSLGAALLDRLLELKWIRPGPDQRTLTITDSGRSSLRKTFGVEPTL